MRVTDQNELKIFESIIDEYSTCFYERDIERLKNLYVSDGDIIYFDNHANCDSIDLEDHLKKVGDFFRSGNIEELISEDFVVFRHGQGACMLIKYRYPSHPKPCARTTYYLELHNDQWKIRHIHCSFDPNEE
jgi:ketosteroid isomerase-like protein